MTQKDSHYSKMGIVFVKLKLQWVLKTIPLNFADKAPNRNEFWHIQLKQNPMSNFSQLSVRL